MSNVLIFLIIFLIVSNLMSSIVNYFTMQKYKRYTNLVHELNNQVIDQNKKVLDIYNAIIDMGKNAEKKERNTDYEF